MFKRLTKLRAEREQGDKGFTLIELLVVVVIIGILIAIAIPLYLNYRKGANDKSAMSDLRGAVSTLEQCSSDNNTYPTAVSDVGVLTGCDNQKINLSTGTKLIYKPDGNSPTANYIIGATNDNGNSIDYCYASAAGGSVKSGTAVTEYADVCP